MECPKRGFLYIVYGKSRYLECAIQSCESLRRHTPKAHVTIIMDKGMDLPEKHPFDDVIIMSADLKYRFGPKVYNMCKSPYMQTIYLDADTYVCSDLSFLFGALKGYNVAMRYTHWALPICNPNFHSSLIVFRQTPKIRKMLRRWIRVFDRDAAFDPYVGDQKFLTRVIYETGDSVLVLPNVVHCTLASHEPIVGTVPIFASHLKELPEIAEFINQTKEYRWYDMDSESLFIRDNSLGVRNICRNSPEKQEISDNQ